jgi:ABC-type multidrug transport system permease subunit
MHLGFALATLLLGMLIAGLFRREVMVAEIIVGLGAVAFTLSGFTWPREMFPWVLNRLVSLYPLTWLLEEGAKVWYGTGYALNWMAFVWLVLLFGGLLTLLIYKRRNEGVLVV